MKKSKIFILIAFGLIVIGLISAGLKYKPAEILNYGSESIYYDPYYTPVVLESFLFDSDYMPVIDKWDFYWKRVFIMIKGFSWAGVPGILSLIIGFYFKHEEKKLDPLNNLNQLKDKGVVTELEYQEKYEAAKNFETRQKELKKTIHELESLRSKGILTEDEFNHKRDKLYAQQETITSNPSGGNKSIQNQINSSPSAKILLRTSKINPEEDLSDFPELELELKLNREALKSYSQSKIGEIIVQFCKSKSISKNHYVSNLNFCNALGGGKVKFPVVEKLFELGDDNFTEKLSQFILDYFRVD